MDNDQKQKYCRRIEELRAQKISAECGYPSKEEMLRISSSLIDLCYEILSQCPTDS